MSLTTLGRSMMAKMIKLVPESAPQVTFYVSGPIDYDPATGLSSANETSQVVRCFVKRGDTTKTKEDEVVAGTYTICLPVGTLQIMPKVEDRVTFTMPDGSAHNCSISAIDYETSMVEVMYVVKEL